MRIKYFVGILLLILIGGMLMKRYASDPFARVQEQYEALQAQEDWRWQQ